MIGETSQKLHFGIHKFLHGISKILLLTFILALSGLSISAQENESNTRNGRVTGKIIDRSGELLLGATIHLEGTSIGTITDFDGIYSLDKVPPGDYTLIARYLGYKDKEFPITIAGGQSIEQDFLLEYNAIEGEEVVVTAQARGQMAAINDQLSSRTIKNVVSSEKIQELPDDNAAKALSRLPGVSLQGGDKVVIRGIQAKMNKILVNGVELPSTSMDDRSTSLGFVSANMLSGIEVYKVLTPDMDADAIGGTVNLRLKEAPVGFHVDALAQGEYNTQDHTADNYKAWLSVSDRFFKNKLGVFVQGNINRINSGTDRGSASYTRGLGVAGQDPGYGLATYGLESYTYNDVVNISENMGGSLILDYKIGSGKLVFMNTYSDQDVNSSSHQDVLSLLSGSRAYNLDRDTYNRKLLLNSLQGEHQFWGMYLDYSLTHAYSERNTIQSYEIDFHSGSQDFAPYSETQLTSFRPNDVFGIEFYEDAWRDAVANGGDTYDDSFMERKLSANLNLRIPITITENISGSIKVGGKMHHLSRESDRNEQIARLAEVQWNQGAREFLLENGINPDATLRLEDFRDPDYTEERGQYFLGGNHSMTTVINTKLTDPYIRLSSPAWFTDFADTWKDDYNGTEDLAAAYIMTELNFGTKWILLGGVRYENLETDYNAYFTVRTHFETGYNLDTLNQASKSHGHWFPNLQLRYKATDWFDVRFAYSKTTSRPDFSYIIPKKYVHLAQWGSTGNANLRPTISQNLDLYTSFHHKHIGLFTVGGFYKQMTDVFYPTARLVENLPEEVEWPEQGVGDIPTTDVSSKIRTFMNNPYPALVRGIEFDWQTNFWYLPKPLNALVFNINYTRVFSEMDYQEFRLYDYLEPNPTPGRPPIKRFAETDTFRTARLLHQGDHILNIALGVDIKGFSGRISFRMQDDVITSVGDRPETDQFSEKFISWDLTLKQELPVKGLSLFVNAVNLFHASSDGYRLFGPDFEVHNNAYKSYNPRKFQFGIRYEL